MIRRKNLPPISALLVLVPVTASAHPVAEGLDPFSAALDEQATLLPYLPYLALSSALGLLAALSLRLPVVCTAALALLAGGLTGHDTLLHARLTNDGTIGIIAAGLAVLLICFNAGWLASKAKKFWMQIALRITAAWLTALSLMMLGLVVVQTP